MSAQEREGEAYSMGERIFRIECEQKAFQEYESMQRQCVGLLRNARVA